MCDRVAGNNGPVRPVSVLEQRLLLRDPPPVADARQRVAINDVRGAPLRRPVAAVAVLAAAFAAIPSPAVAAVQAADPAVQRVVYEFERTTDGPATLRWIATRNAGFGDQQLIGAVLTHDEAGRLAGTEFPFVVALQNVDGGAEFYSEGRRIDCSDTGDPQRFCEEGFQSASAGITEFERVDEGGRGQASGMLVVQQGVELNMRLDDSSRGWQLRRSTAVTAHVVKAQEGDSVGVDGPGSADGAEVFFSAAGRGSSGGSVAIGQPPCGGPVGSPLSLGVGSVELLGGEQAPSLTCPLDLADSNALGDFALQATDWRLDGLAAGSAFEVGTPRLVIFDLPPRKEGVGRNEAVSPQDPAAQPTPAAATNAAQQRERSAPAVHGPQSLAATGASSPLPVLGVVVMALSLRMRRKRQG